MKNSMKKQKQIEEFAKKISSLPDWKEASIKAHKKEAFVNKPRLKLVGEDGNAFFILGQAQRVARTAGWSKEKIEQFISEATAGDYDHLLGTCMKYFEVI